MKFVVALSGGVDSVVLLDTLVKSAKHSLVVAHFDHGIRPESDADARFCLGLAQKYSLPFESQREELGSGASEAIARARRYDFLNEVAKRHDARIVTAHHKDDLIETIAINLERGTGWRGLAVFGNRAVNRPLLHMTKREIYDYALRNSLEWVEDETNRSDNYLRNRIRKRLAVMSPEIRTRLAALYGEQIFLRSEIEEVIGRLLPFSDDRAFMRSQDNVVARELLHGLTKGQLTRPQLDRFREGVDVLRPGAIITLGGGLIARIKKDSFSLDRLEHLHRG